MFFKKKLPEYSSTDIPEARHGKENRYFQSPVSPHYIYELTIMEENPLVKELKKYSSRTYRM